MENTTNATPPQTAAAPGSALVAAAEQMDWTQVVLNHQYGPPCFCLGKDGRFCARAQTWAGHPSSHLYTSLADLISLLEGRGNIALDTLIAVSAKDVPMERQANQQEDAFNAHLDGCERCRNHPFNLCSIGLHLLGAVAAGQNSEHVSRDAC